jgi:hypothetical protein
MAVRRGTAGRRWWERVWLLIKSSWCDDEWLDGWMVGLDRYPYASLLRIVSSVCISLRMKHAISVCLSVTLVEW